MKKQVSKVLDFDGRCSKQSYGLINSQTTVDERFFFLDGLFVKLISISTVNYIDG